MSCAIRFGSRRYPRWHVGVSLVPAAERCTAAVAWTGSGLRQLRFPCVPKRQFGNALLHFTSFTVCPLAFFPNPVDLVVVAAQIKGRVDNREENNREYRDADHPHARLPPKIRRR